MSALPEQRNTLAGLTLDAVLSDRRGGGNSNSRTLFDIIRDDPTTKSIYPPKDRKSWRLLRDKLRLKRAGAAWTSSVRVPASDLPIHAPNTRRVSLMSSSDNNSSPGGSAPETRPMFMRRSSTRFAAANHDEAADVSRPGEVPPSRSFKPQSSRHNSPRMANRDGDEINPDPFDVARDGTRRLSVVLADERAMSAREAVAAQEAAEAAAKAELVASPAEATEEEEGGGGGASEDLGGEAASSSGGGQPVRMSLMDLLEETDREMGVEGSRYMIGDDDDEEFDDEEEEEEDEGVENGGIEYNCCVCMVRHKGAAFIPCGHTFCRLCSRELWVQRGNCPLCNNYIVEILDIF